MDNNNKLLMPGPDFFIDEYAFPDKVDIDLLMKFFTSIGAEPFIVTSKGEPAILLRGLCHHSNSGHSSVLCSASGTCTCFSACGDTAPWYVYAARAWRVPVNEAKDRIRQWFKDNNIDIKSGDCENYVAKPYTPEIIEPLPALSFDLISSLYKKFDQSPETMKKLVWRTEAGIKVSTMWEYGVAYNPEHKTIILPHHNINGEIIGIYERHFAPLQKEVIKMMPDVDKRQLVGLPHAKYMPLYCEELNRSLSFPNSKNLYGLFRAKEEIKKTGQAIVFEGAKSVMLARQWGIKNAVASHTFNVGEGHVSLLLQCGAKEIITGLDKQYQVADRENEEYALYCKKTEKLADRVKDYVKVSRIEDTENLIDYKDAPVDKGEEIFKHLLERRMMLN